MNVSGMLFAAVLFAVSGLAHAQNVHGILKVVKGDVQIKAAANGQTSKARIGGKVFPKDIVITAKDSRAKIVMVDKNEINVSPESQIEIQQYEYDPAKGKKEVLLNVIYGKVRAKVEQKYDGKTSNFKVKTPAAVAGVRGTDFLTSYNRTTRASSVVTFHGKVEFGVPGPAGAIANAVFVTPGTEASTTAGAAPSPPAPVPKEQLAKMDTDTAAETPKVDGAKPGAGTTEEKKEDKKDEPAKKDDAGAKKDEAKKEDATAKKDDAGAKKDETAAKKDEGAPAKKDETAAKKEDAAPAKKDDAATAKKDDGGGKKSDGAGTAASPAAATAKDDGKKTDTAKSEGGSSGGGRSPASSGGGTASGTKNAGTGPTPGGPSSGPSGGPASPGSSTIGIDTSRDLVGGGSAPIVAPVIGGGLPSAIVNTGTPVVPTVPKCDFCNSVIQDSTSKLIIKVIN